MRMWRLFTSSPPHDCPAWKRHLFDWRIRGAFFRLRSLIGPNGNSVCLNSILQKVLVISNIIPIPAWTEHYFLRIQTTFGVISGSSFCFLHDHCIAYIVLNNSLFITCDLYLKKYRSSFFAFEQRMKEGIIFIFLFIQRPFLPGNESQSNYTNISYHICLHF